MSSDTTPGAEARRREVRAAGQRKGLLIVHTGDGKRKTPAAFGLTYPCATAG